MGGEDERTVGWGGCDERAYMRIKVRIRRLSLDEGQSAYMRWHSRSMAAASGPEVAEASLEADSERCVATEAAARRAC